MKDRNKRISIIEYISLVICCLLMISVKMSVLAEENTVISSDGVIQVTVSFIEADGTSHDIRSGCGICIGGENGIASNLLTTSTLITVSEEEFHNLCLSYEIAEEDQNKASIKIRVMLTQDIELQATVNTVSEEMNLAILNLNQTIYDRNIYLFDLDADIEAGDVVYSVGNPAYGIQMGVCQNTVTIGRNNYLMHDIGVNSMNEGGALLNEAGELIGMNQSTIKDEHFYALDIRDIASVLKMFGITFISADHTDYSADFSNLQATVDVAEKISLDGYTVESKNNMLSAIENAKQILDNPDASQAEVDAALTNLLEAQKALTEDKHMSKAMLIALIGIGVLFVIIIILILVIVLGKKKREKKLAEEKEREEKKPKVENKPYEPVQFMMPQLQKNIQASQNGISADLKGFALVSDTKNQYKEQPGQFCLVHTNTRQMIMITKKEYHIGSASNGNDLVLSSGVVSRNHAVLYVQDNELLLCDMNSTNGTYLNGKQIQAKQLFKLQKGDIVTFADQSYRIH